MKLNFFLVATSLFLEYFEGTDFYGIVYSYVHRTEEFPHQYKLVKVV